MSTQLSICPRMGRQIFRIEDSASKLGAPLMLERNQPGSQALRINANTPVLTNLTAKHQIVSTTARTIVFSVAFSRPLRFKIRGKAPADARQQVSRTDGLWSLGCVCPRWPKYRSHWYLEGSWLFGTEY